MNGFVSILEQTSHVGEPNDIIPGDGEISRPNQDPYFQNTYDFGFAAVMSFLLNLTEPIHFC